MTTTVAMMNIVLGVVYLQYGSMTMIEMFRQRARMGFSHFGAAWVAMAFTCGPHHFAHGVHMIAGHESAGALDLVTVLVGFPAGLAWFLLRIEAFRGGRGDRFIAGNPLWVLCLPTLAGVYVTALVAGALNAGQLRLDHLALALPNILLVVIYCLVGYFLTRTQLANRRPLGGWSLSGLALSVIFPTCALMHGVFSFYTLSGRYSFSAHNLVIDWLAVPAGLYFLWVVHALYRGSFRDWNGSPLREPELVVA